MALESQCSVVVILSLFLREVFGQHNQRNEPDYAGETPSNEVSADVVHSVGSFT